MPSFEATPIDTWIASCDGGGSAIEGHPKVYLNLSASGKVACPYCSRLFIHRSSGGGGSGVVTAGAAGDLQAKPSDRAPPTALARVPGPPASPTTRHAASTSSNPAKP